MQVYLIINGRLVGQVQIEGLADGKLLVPVQVVSETAGGVVRRDVTTGEVTISYCGQDWCIKQDEYQGDQEGRPLLPVDALGDFLRLRWRLCETAPVLIMGRVEPALDGKRIIIDPGHGGMDSGEQGLYYLSEQQLNYSIAMMVKDILEVAGAEVLLTRDEDQHLTSAHRVEKAKSDCYDALLSVHQNSYYAPDTNGTEVYYYENWRSSQLAAYILNQIVEELGTRNRGVKEAAFYVLRHVDCPAVLMKVGFLSNDEDAKVLRREKMQYKAASAIFRGVRQFFEEKANRVS